MLIRNIREISKLKNKAVECRQRDNVVREGYLTASEEYKLLTRSAEVYDKWVQKVKKYQGKQSKSELELAEINFKEQLDILDQRAIINEKIEEIKKEIEYNNQQRENIIKEIENEINYINRNNKEGE